MFLKLFTILFFLSAKGLINSVISFEQLGIGVQLSLEENNLLQLGTNIFPLTLLHSREFWLFECSWV